MNKLLLGGILLALVLFVACTPETGAGSSDLVQAPGAIEESVKPRVLVLTDIENEPDDAQSLVRFLLYANEMDIEGLLATTSVWMRDTTRVDKIRGHLEAYGQVRTNLLVHADFRSCSTSSRPRTPTARAGGNTPRPPGAVLPATSITTTGPITSSTWSIIRGWNNTSSTATGRWRRGIPGWHTSWRATPRRFST